MLNIGGRKIARRPLEERLRQINGATDAAALSVAGRNGADILLFAFEIPDQTHVDAVLRRARIMVDGVSPAWELFTLSTFPRSSSGKLLRPQIAAQFRHTRDNGAIVLWCPKGDVASHVSDGDGWSRTGDDRWSGRTMMASLVPASVRAV